MRLVMLGAPGAGKGTQADRLAVRYGIPHVSTGDLFRANLSQGTALGQTAQRFMSQGQLVPDEVTEAMAWERLNAGDAETGYILDGFPRNVAQAQHFESKLVLAQQSLRAVVHIYVEPVVLERRLTGRRTCPGCKASYHVVFNPPALAGICDACGAELVQRDDDRPETVKKRLEVYMDETAPLVNYYSERGLLVMVDGNWPVDNVTDAILARLEGDRGHD
ncbi:MAG: adenylate kinase [Firmicutes bacterium]|nr:adenylate kinase [Bacillota bacterium]MCL5066303.1 adenylate kinase [Bacillota bacterium]